MSNTSKAIINFVCGNIVVITASVIINREAWPLGMFISLIGGGLVGYISAKIWTEP